MCFTLAEARLINDTLWTGVDRRRAMAILWVMYKNAKNAGESAETDLGLVRDQLIQCNTAVGVERTAKQAAEKDADTFRRRARARFWNGLAVGIALTGLGAYAVGLAR